VSTDLTTEAEASRSSRIDIITSVAVVALAALLAYGRLPADIRNVVWAEDGRVFLGDRLRAGVLQSTFAAYEGYLHVIPRLLTDLAVWLFPLEKFAVASTALSCAVTGLVAGLVYVCSRDLIARRFFRVMLALITVLAPTLSNEVLGNFANLHWLLLWLSPWLFLAVPRTWAGAAGLGIVGLACGLTEIQMLLFAPLALVNSRNRRSLIVAAATMAGVLAQILCTVVNPRTPNLQVKPGLLDIVVGYGELPVLGAFDADSSRLGDALAAGGWAATALVTMLVLGILSFALLPSIRGRGDTRILPLALVGGSFIAWAAAIWLNPRTWWQYADLDAEQLQQLTATRYVVAPSMLLLAALVFAAARCFDATGRGRVAAGVALGILAMAAASNYYVNDVARSDGPPWAQSVTEARESCDDGRAAVEVRTMPVGWSLSVPCDHLRVDQNQRETR
jgi:hypothetical protein